MKQYYVYILKCSDGSFYVGQTNNLETRIADHHNGKGCAYTKNKRPLEVVFSESFQTRNEAFATEQKIKNWSHAKKQALCSKSWEQLQDLAKKKNWS